MIWQIRPAQKADIPALLALSQQSFVDTWTYEQYKIELTHDWSYTYLLEETDPYGQENTILCGFYLFWLAVDEVHLHQLVIEETRRRQGLGRKLVEDLQLRAAQLGATCIILEVRASNQAAQRLYQSAGFIQIGERKKYYDSPTEDALVLEYRLANTRPALRP